MNADRFAPGSLDPAVPITQQIYLRLREAIIQSDLTPGDTISESEIARLCDVSRQPVREAFIRLAGEGLLSIRPQRGTTITRIAYDAVLEARFLREAVESDIITILANDPDPELLLELDSQMAAQKAAVEDGPQEFISLDDRFHRTLAEAAGKTGVWHMIDGQRAQMDRVRFMSVCRTPVKALVEQHAAIVEGIKAANVNAAVSAMRGHLREMLSDLPQILKANPESFEASNDKAERFVNVPI